jgi:tetratricopeptide (TPR) repeat protein
VRGSLAIWAIVVLSIGTIGRRVHAQGENFRSRDAGFIGKDVAVLEIDDCPPPPQVAPERLRAIGSEHFTRGEVLYVQGDYKGAVNELVAAYCILPFYSILKDIGQAYERELDYERAIAYLERYVMQVPDDAQRLNACAPDPQDDKRNVIARIKTLQQLRAKIRVNTDPDGALITLSNETGIKNRGLAGQELEVMGGRYTVLIEHKGFHPVTQEVRAEIGKPYTLFAKLDPRKGKLRVRVVPATARLFIDQRQIATTGGAYEDELPGGRYTLTAEAAEHLPVTREIEILSEQETPISLELPPQPQRGRRQFIGYATIAGGIAGGTLAGATSAGGVIATGTALGIGAGFFGSYFITPRDLPLGTSSLAITSSLIGGTLGGTATVLFTNNGNVIAPAIGSGLILGGLTGYYAGSRLRISPGDAAVINSGALWGTVVGSLFSGSFEATADRRIGAGLVLSGLGMGSIGGVLMTRYFEISRTRAALIDLGGVVGIFVGIAIENVVSQAGDGTTSSAERTANYSLGGLATGLILTGIITRNLDAPKLSVSPVVSRAQAGGQTTTTFGLGGTF